MNFGTLTSANGWIHRRVMCPPPDPTLEAHPRLEMRLSALSAPRRTRFHHQTHFSKL